MPIRNPHAKPKAAFSHRLNIQYFVEQFGLECCALLTLVFPRRITWNQANENLGRAQRILLDPSFSAWICVVELHKDGRPHFHFVVASEHDLRTGFDFEARERAVAIHRSTRSQHRRMTPSESAIHKVLLAQSTENATTLRALWKGIRSKLPNYGFGRAHPGTLEPIWCADAVANYLVKSFGTDAVPRPAAMKGAHLVRYSRDQIRGATQSFSWNGSRSKLRRRQLARIGATLGLGETEFCPTYGRHWHYHCMEMVASLDYDHGSVDGPVGWSDEQIRAAAEIYLKPRDGSFPTRDA